MGDWANTLTALGMIAMAGMVVIGLGLLVLSCAVGF